MINHPSTSRNSESGIWTVSIWRNNYLSSSLYFLQDKPRSGRPVGIDGEQRAKITVLACSKTPVGRAT
jgi:putative transposase